MRCTAVAFFSGVAATSNTTKTSLLQDGRMNPIAKVLGLLKNMKSEVEEEGAKDKELFEKMDCWCKSNDAQKRAAMDAATKKIAELQSSIEEGVSTESKLSTEIEAYTDSRAKNQDSLKQATEMRDKENAEFTAEEKELVQAISQLGGAVEALEKNFAEFMQTKSEGSKKQVEQALMQTSNIVQTYAAKYSDVMDLDVAAINDAFPVAQPHEDAFTQGEQQRPSASLMTDVFNSLMAVASKKVGMLQQPADYKSYNAQSGKILGILKQMKEGMEGDLADSRATETGRSETFAKLKEAKEGEIAAATEAINDKTNQLATTRVDLANDKSDLEDTEQELDLDTKFMKDLTVKCAAFEKEFDERTETRNEELSAIAAAMGVLTNDDARDLLSGTVGNAASKSFVQFVSVQSSESQAKKLRAQAVSVLQKAYRKSKGSMLLSLAFAAQLDQFTKVKAAMDKMRAELKQQKAEEFQKKEQCEKELDENEDSIKESNYEKKDLETKISELEVRIEDLHTEIEEKSEEISETQTSVKRSGEDRASQNKQYQGAVADQRAAEAILKQVVKKLESFYRKKSLLAQPYNDGRAGRSTGDAPGDFKPYKKAGAADGVLGMIEMIIGDAKREEQEMISDERNAQEDYETMLRDSFDQIARNQRSISDRREALAQADVALNGAKGDLKMTDGELEHLGHTKADLHGDCDWLLESFKARQQELSDEMDAIDQAKAILSGAKFD
mmetsp:Transcript_44645/g.95269  ORF Transcript_44645/g.95269 Transcript_44645/m.95269 type:complete len:729 (-) Transcript_44645:38-2224(-)